MCSSMLLLQWLDDASDGNEAAQSFSRYHRRVDVDYVPLPHGADQNQVCNAILDWATDNPVVDVIYIGCHGFDHGLGPTDEPNGPHVLSYADLWACLRDAHNRARAALLADKIERRELLPDDSLCPDEGQFILWLGACSSTNCVRYFVNSECDTLFPVMQVVAFGACPTPAAVAQFLDSLMADQTGDGFRYSHELHESLIRELGQWQPVVYLASGDRTQSLLKADHGYSS